MRWYENDIATGNAISEHFVQITSDVLQIQTGDVDGDGDTDILTLEAYGIDSIGYWYENSGDVSGFLEGRLMSDEFVTSMSVADVDGDGDLDVVTESQSCFVFSCGGSVNLRLHRNSDGLGTFATTSIAIFTTPVIRNLAYANVFVVDMDQDSDNDILFPVGRDGRVTWYENVDGIGDYSTEHVVSKPLPGEPYVSLVADLDNDGDFDLVFRPTDFRADQRFYWYRYRMAGDVNNDDIFNSSDLVRVFQAGKYETEAESTFDEGDWNGDGIFNSLDLVFVFRNSVFTATAKSSKIASAIDSIFVENTKNQNRYLQFVP